MKKLIGVVLVLAMVLSMASAYAGVDRMAEAEVLNYFLIEELKDVPGACVVYSGVEYFADNKIMLVSVSYYTMEYMSPSDVRDNADIFYELFDNTIEGLSTFSTSTFSLLVKEANTQLWIIDNNGIYDCTIGEVIDLRRG